MSALPTAQPNFDRIARSYRWLEYLALGPLLQRTRTHYLPALAHCRNALILGDGDGRFVARLLATYPGLQVHAVDISASMLALLRARVGPLAHLRTTQADARSFTPAQPYDLPAQFYDLPAQPYDLPAQFYDLVVTHFLLDCLTQLEVDTLVARLGPTLAPNSLWLISEFRIPAGLLRWPARLYIRLLYLAFRILTGLSITRLPDFASPLRSAGFVRTAVHRRLFGMLTTEIWRRP